MKDADGIVGAQHGDRARQTNARRARRRRRENDRWCGRDEVGPVMLAHAEDVETDVVGELDLLDQIVKTLLGGHRVSGARIRRGLREGIDAELHRAPRA